MASTGRLLALVVLCVAASAPTALAGSVDGMVDVVVSRPPLDHPEVCVDDRGIYVAHRCHQRPPVTVRDVVEEACAVANIDDKVCTLP